MQRPDRSTVHSYSRHEGFPRRAGSYSDQSRPLNGNTLALANKRFRYIVTPILYERVTLEGHRALHAFHNTLVKGRPILREYPTSLKLEYPPFARQDSTESCRDVIKQILMRVPNLIDLHLNLDPFTTQYLLEEPQYPFQLIRFQLVPRRNFSFIELLEAQPSIRHLILKYDYNGIANREWSLAGLNSTLEIGILPNLEYFQAELLNDIRFFVPHRPIKSVLFSTLQKDTDFHRILAMSSAPLERLNDFILFGTRAVPSELSVVLERLSSLEFCQDSLSQYSLKIFPNGHRGPGVWAPKFPVTDLSEQLATIRGALSKFPEMKKFNLTHMNERFRDLSFGYRKSIPELSKFQVWKESCPKLEEVSMFGIILNEG